MIGLGVGIDYALFILTRFRNDLDSGLEPRQAAINAVDTAGRAVLFAGTTVIIALMGMFLLNISFLYGVAVAAALSVLFTMIAALTLLPALLTWVGHRVNKLEDPGPRGRPELDARRQLVVPLEPLDPAPAVARRDRLRRHPDPSLPADPEPSPRRQRRGNQPEGPDHPRSLRPARRRLRPRLQRPVHDGREAAGQGRRPGARTALLGAEERRRRRLRHRRHLQPGEDRRALPGLSDDLTAERRHHRACSTTSAAR